MAIKQKDEGNQLVVFLWVASADDIHRIGTGVSCKKGLFVRWRKHHSRGCPFEGLPNGRGTLPSPAAAAATELMLLRRS